jgi:hypothetical protein
MIVVCLVRIVLKMLAESNLNLPLKGISRNRHLLTQNHSTLCRRIT